MVKKLYDIKKVEKKLENKKKILYSVRFHKYIVDYKIEGNNIIVYSNLGYAKRMKKTHSNITKLNRIIMKNKIAIRQRIQNYDEAKKNRLLVAIFNVFLVSVSGLFIIVSFFTGLKYLILASCLTFSLLVITTSLNGLKHFIYAKEIQNLKEITNYKVDDEYVIPEINLKILKKN